MISAQDAARFLELDKEPAPAGRRRSDPLEPRLRAAWLQFQALRALAVEAAPEPGERLLRQALDRCAKSSRLRGGAPADALPVPAAAPAAPARRPFPAWLTAALALGVLGSVGLAFWAENRSGGSLTQGPAAAPAPVPSQISGVPFEFPQSLSPVAEALAEPGDETGGGDADDVHDFSAADRQASRLLSEQLHRGEKRGRPRAAHPRPKPQARPGAKPAAEKRGLPRPAGTMAAPQRPAHPAPGTAVLNAAPAAPTAGMTLASNELAAAGPGVALTLRLPQRQDMDARLFSNQGVSRRVLASGRYGPGELLLTLTARDDQGRPLEPGSYYLRVMTPWFSRVEPIQIR